MTAWTTLRQTAEDHQWAITDLGYGRWLLTRDGARRISLYIDTEGRVSAATAQRANGRVFRISGRARADQITELLTTSRWPAPAAAPHPSGKVAR